MHRFTPSHDRAFSAPTASGLSVLCLVAALTACGGGSDPGGSGTDDPADAADATSDGGLLPDGAIDPDARPNPDGETPDGDTPDGETDGEDPGDAPDGQSDGEDPDDADGQGGGDSDAEPDPDGGDPSDADGGSDPDGADGDADPGDVRVFVPGTLPLPNYIQCDENSDCPNGTGNCLTVLTLNREDSSGRLRIPMNEVFPELERTGLCSLDCVVGEAACSTLALTVDPTPWQCQLVYADDSAYPTDGSGARPPFPFDDQLDLGEMAAGPAFGALCRPPFERSEAYAPDFCVECSSALNCHPGSACVVVSPWAAEPADAGFCLSPCAVGGGCPSGFECRQPDAARDGLIAGEDTQAYCFPTLGSCSPCTDADGDGFGVGGCAASGGATAVDCDDLDPLAWWEGPTSVHPFPEVCGPDEDANCNGIADRTEQVGTVAFGAAHCSECGDVCDRSAPEASTFECVRLTTGIEGTCRPVCDQPTRFFDCDGDADNGCEAEVTDVNLLFVPDCDGDGVGRANALPQFDCDGAGSLTIFTDVDGDDATDDRRDCDVVQAVATEGSGFGTDCDDGDGAVNPSGVEVCDGIDNDCDGETDPYELFQLGDTCSPSDASVVGACRSGATRVCDDAGGVTCQPALPSFELCDGIDNDCDGLVDNLGAPTPGNRLGEACRASDDPGPCGAGALICRDGGLVCAPALLPEGDVPGDGNDADCDGVDADTERAIFVAVGGATVQGPGPRLGTAENPVGTLERAYELIRVREFTASPITQVILASGDYSLPHGIAPFGANFTMIGGWSWNPDTNVWTPPTSGRSDIEITDVCPCDPAIDSTGVCVQSTCEPQNGYLAAIDIASPFGVRISNVNVLVAAQPAALGPVVGLACWLLRTGDGPVSSCGSLELNQVRIEMENGQSGEPHPAPAAGESGRQSSTQAPSPCGNELSCGRPGFTGGASSCGASGGTGAGIAGGNTGGCFGGTNFAIYSVAVSGGAGAPADVGGAAGAVTVYNGNCVPSGPAQQGGRGRTRAERGTGGGPGTGAPVASPLSPGSATAGGSGLPGGGGGGGGAAGDLEFLFDNRRFGGGGSSGGCGGNGGAAGRDGGTIIGLLIDDPLSAPVLRSVEVNVGSGGAGGAGQAGGAGGTGIGPVNQGALTLGGASGHGAGGGGGGGGAGGSAIGIARWPSVRVVLTPSVGTAGAGGAGGAAGTGGSGGIVLTLDAATTVFETAAGGVAGTRGADGISARFCSLAPGAPPAGEVSCR